MTNADKVRENRLRRMATRQGLKLVRSRRRDIHALDYGLLRLIAEEKILIETKNMDDIDEHLRGAAQNRG